MGPRKKGRGRPFSANGVGRWRASGGDMGPGNKRGERTVSENGREMAHGSGLGSGSGDHPGLEDPARAGPSARPVLSLRSRMALPFAGAVPAKRALRPKKGNRGETPEMTERAISTSLNLGPARWGECHISRGLAVSMSLSVGAARGVRVAFRPASRFPWI